MAEKRSNPAGLPSKGIDFEQLKRDLDALDGSIDQVLAENGRRPPALGG